MNVLPTQLRVVELYELTNNSELALPEGANERLSLTPEGFAYTSPIPPGSGPVLPCFAGMTFA